MSCNEWIQAVVRGKTFADVGGLWGTVNEQVTVAAKAGAAEVTMMDIAPLDHEMWSKFHERCREQGVVCTRYMQGNIDDPHFPERVGSFDVVHCAGVVYHCPNPLYSISQLARITRKTMILGSTVIPLRISNDAGTIAMEDNTALLIPALSDRQKRVVAVYFEAVGAKIAGISLPVESGWSLNDYALWWYLFTTNFVAGLLEVCGFKVLETTSEWQGRAAYFLAERDTGSR